MRVILRQLAERMAPRIFAWLGRAPPSQQGAQADEPERSFVPESLAKLSSSVYLLSLESWRLAWLAGVHCACFGGAAGVQDFFGVNRDWIP
jgi:hypothetical protein